MDINVNDDGDETAQQTVDDDELDKIQKKKIKHFITKYNENATHRLLISLLIKCIKSD